MKKRIQKIATLCLLGFLLGTSAAWVQAKRDVAGAVARIEPAAGDETAGNKMADADIGGPFTLTDQDGKTVTEKDYADSYKLVYFGFTMCPDVCPAGLQKITTALNKLGDDAAMVQPLFITVDPARDTPDVMKKYLEMFHPRLIGLTGTAEQIGKVEQEYKVYAAKAQDEHMSDYTMNHSSYTFLMSPDNKLVSLFSADDSPSDMAAGIERALQTE